MKVKYGLVRLQLTLCVLELDYNPDEYCAMPVLPHVHQPLREPSRQPPVEVQPVLPG